MKPPCLGCENEKRNKNSLICLGCLKRLQYDDHIIKKDPGWVQRDDYNEFTEMPLHFYSG